MVDESSERTSLIGKYRPLLQLGEGGMALVYLASYESDNDFRKLLVLKCLKPELAGLKEMREAFLAEARLTARMNHPNVVQVREVFEIGPTPVIAMEYLEGRPLDKLRKESEGLPRAVHLHILAEALRGLEYFHSLVDEDGTPLEPVHRDLSPHNIFVTREGTVKVLDFGIAKSKALGGEQTQQGIVKGKFRYMAPEQITGENISARTDLFAAGIMLWEAAAGKRLYASQGDGDIMRALLEGQITSIREAAPDLPEQLYVAVEAALVSAPEKRVASAKALRELVLKAIQALDEKADQDSLAALMLKRYGEDFSELQRKVGKRLKTRSSTWSEPPPTLSARVEKNESTVRVHSSEWPSRTPLAHATPTGSHAAPAKERPSLSFSTVLGIAAVGALVVLGLERIGSMAQKETPAEASPKTAAQPQSAKATEPSIAPVPTSPPERKSPTARPTPPRPTPLRPTLSPLVPEASGTTASVKPDLASSRPCSGATLIDDFEDKNGLLCAADHRRGAWNVFFDGTGQLTPTPGYFVKTTSLAPPRGKSTQGLSVSGRSLKDWGAGLAVPFRDGEPYDISRYEGIRLWVRSPESLPVRIKVATLDTLSSAYGGHCEPVGAKTCDDHYSLRRMVGPNWYYLQARFDEMKQIGFGVATSFNPKEAVELHIAIDNDDKSGLDFDLIVDDVEFF